MAGSVVNTYGSTNTSLTNIQTVMDLTRKGLNAITLSNYSTLATPLITSGSVVEIGGALYGFSSDEAISTSNVISTTASKTWYIELVPSSSVVTAQFSTTTPTWRDDYNGYYLSTSSINRIIGSVFFYYDSANRFLGKKIITERSKVNYLTGNLNSSYTYIAYPSGLSYESAMLLNNKIWDNTLLGYNSFETAIYLRSTDIMITISGSTRDYHLWLTSVNAFIGIY